jgi:hypothetical protein
VVIDGLQYDFHNDTWAVTKNVSNNNREIRIKETIDGFPIVAIGARVFCDNEDLEYIHIPMSVCSIGEYAFAGCTNLKRVKEIPSKTTFAIGVIMVYRRAFQDCKSLVVFDTTRRIVLAGGQNFQRCHKLETVGIHNELYGDIPNQAFQACLSLEFLVIDKDSDLLIESNALNWCSSMNDIYVKAVTVNCEDEETWNSLARKKIFCRPACNLLDLGFEGTEVVIWENN